MDADFTGFFVVGEVDASAFAGAALAVGLAVGSGAAALFLEAVAFTDIFAAGFFAAATLTGVLTAVLSDFTVGLLAGFTVFATPFAGALADVLIAWGAAFFGLVVAMDPISVREQVKCQIVTQSFAYFLSAAITKVVS